MNLDIDSVKQAFLDSIRGVDKFGHDANGTGTRNSPGQHLRSRCVTIFVSKPLFQLGPDLPVQVSPHPGNVYRVHDVPKSSGNNRKARVAAHRRFMKWTNKKLPKEAT